MTTTPDVLGVARSVPRVELPGSDPDRCDVASCDGRIRHGWRAAQDGDVEPAGYCARCRHLAY